MEKIKLCFLGTGQAIPTSRRNHTSILLQYKSENILFDCGEGTQRQFRKANINPCKLTRIFITHWHGDHILGLPGLLQTLLLNQYKKKLYIYGPRGTSYYIKKIISLFVPYNNIHIEIKELSNSTAVKTHDFIINSLPMKHSCPCNAYSFKELDKLRLKKDKIKKLKLPEIKLLQQLKQGKNIKLNNKTISFKDYTYEEKGKKISFIFDTALNPNCKKISKDSDLLISEAVYLNNEKDLAKLHEHLTAEQAALIAKDSKSKKLIVSHLSQRYDGSEKLILNEARNKFKNTEIAEDLMCLEI